MVRQDLELGGTVFSGCGKSEERVGRISGVNCELW